MDTQSVMNLPLDELVQSWLKPGIVSVLFQPIVDLSGVRHQVVAVEALARGPKDSAFESPTALFGAARRAGLVGQLDRICIQAALSEARKLPPHLEVFLNVHPQTLSDDCGFPAFLAETASRAGIAPTRLTMEVLEHARVDQVTCKQLRGSIQVLRGHGVRFAVDDVSGAGEDMRRAMSLRPDFVKVDAHVVRGAQHDTRLRALLHAIADQAVRKGARVIAEGIEELRDLGATTAAGISLAQGYLLCRPAPVESFHHITLRAS
jgi:EAL domain-containing protein (putative c-di-GMP-specific phosphodiesterase class I)